MPKQQGIVESRTNRRKEESPEREDVMSTILVVCSCSADRSNSKLQGETCHGFEFASRT